MSTDMQSIAPGNDVSHARQRKVEDNLGLVHHIAGQLYRTYAAQAEFDELLSAGTMGLMGAVDSFDATVGVKFSTYAVPRIRGAIQDELRRMDFMPRSVRRKTRDLDRARTELTQSLGRMPESYEVANHLGIDQHRLWEWEAQGQTATHVSLSEPATERPDGRRRCLTSIVGEIDPHLEDGLNASEEAEHLRQALLRLNPRERTVLTLYYLEELKMSEIAEVLGLTGSRISQIRAQALGKLRKALAPLRAQAA